MNSGFETVLCNSGYCATSLKSGHPLHMCYMWGSHSLVIGASIGPHACGEPVIAFSFGGIRGGVAGDSTGVGALGGDSLRRVLLQYSHTCLYPLKAAEGISDNSDSSDCSVSVLRGLS